MTSCSVTSCAIGLAAAAAILAGSTCAAPLGAQVPASAFDPTERSIADLNESGQVRMSIFHSEKSYFADVRRRGESEVEVDTCEFWSRDILDRDTGDLVRSEPAQMYPQTVHIRDWRIIRIDFHDGRAFC